MAAGLLLSCDRERPTTAVIRVQLLRGLRTGCSGATTNESSNPERTALVRRDHESRATATPVSHEISLQQHSAWLIRHKLGAED